METGLTRGAALPQSLLSAGATPAVASTSRSKKRKRSKASDDFGEFEDSDGDSQALALNLSPRACRQRITEREGSSAQGERRSGALIERFNRAHSEIGSQSLRPFARGYSRIDNTQPDWIRRERTHAIKRPVPPPQNPTIRTPDYGGAHSNEETLGGFNSTGFDKNHNRNPQKSD